MRILVATDQWFPDFVGGPARLATESANRLVRRGHEVAVIAPRAAGGVPEESEEDGVVVHRVLRRTRLPQTITDVTGSRRYARRRTGAFHVVLAHQPTVALGAIAARLDAPTALLYHASALRELRYLRTRLPIGPRRAATYPLASALTVIEAAAVRQSARILVLSEYSRSLVSADHPSCSNKTERIDPGIDMHSFGPGDGRLAARDRLSVSRDETLLVTARRLEPRTGVDRLVEAVGCLDGVSLAVVGSGPLLPELQRLAVALGLTERVRFLGRVSDAALQDWIRAATLFVIPTVAYEGFGMVTAEALACETPVVGTAVGATPELLAPLDERLVAPSAEPDVLAGAIRRAVALAEGPLRRKCRDYARERFDWDHAIEGWEIALERIAGEHA